MLLIPTNGDFSEPVLIEYFNGNADRDVMIYVYMSDCEHKLDLIFNDSKAKEALNFDSFFFEIKHTNNGHMHLSSE